MQSDLTTYGKIIGGGMPVGAYGGRKEVMEVVSPVGKVYQAGTLSGNPVAYGSRSCAASVSERTSGSICASQCFGRDALRRDGEDV